MRINEIFSAALANDDSDGGFLLTIAIKG